MGGRFPRGIIQRHGYGGVYQQALTQLVGTMKVRLVPCGRLASNCLISSVPTQVVKVLCSKSMLAGRGRAVEGRDAMDARIFQVEILALVVQGVVEV